MHLISAKSEDYMPSRKIVPIVMIISACPLNSYTVIILTCAKCIYEKTFIAFRVFMQFRFSQINDTQPDSSTFLSMKVFDLLVIYE